MLSENKRGKVFSRRTLMLGGIKASLLFALIGRLYYLQIMNTERYKTLSDSNRIKLFLIPPLRGRILDRGGRVFAENRNYYRVLFDPERASDGEKTVRKLAEVMHFSDEKRQQLIRKVQQHRSRQPLMLYERLSWKDVARIEVNAPELPGISIDVGQTRHYPMGDLAPHTIGYLGPITESEIKKNPLLNHPDFKIGKSGVELIDDQVLRGQAGVKRMEVNAFGLTVQELSREPSVPGKDLALTLDRRVQEFAAKRLGKASGSVNVIDLKTGGLVCMASTPGFDPVKFSYGVSAEYWKSLIEQPNDPLVNKSVTNQYPPGSTFKTCVALGALEQGFDPETEFYCPGYMILGRRRFNCWKEGGHGHLNMRQGIMHSCNVYFYNTAKKVGMDPIVKMAGRLGLGKITDLDFPTEKPGLVPTREWKLARFKDPWQMGDTFNLGIGQGYMLTTPIQLLQMVARIATGKKIYPSLDAGQRTFDDLGIDPKNLDVVHDGMRMVMEPGGTAYRSHISDPKFAMAGKTGTSQVISKKGYKEIEHELTAEEKHMKNHHALFIGFAPVSAPRFAISVVVEHGGSGSGAAAPVGHDVMQYVEELYYKEEKGNS